MEFVDVDDLESKNKMQNFMSNIREKVQKRNMMNSAIQKKPAASKPTKVIIRKGTGQVKQLEAKIKKLTKEEEGEVFDSIKIVAFKGMAIPMKATKRDKFKRELESSKYMNNYLRNNLYSDYIDGLNQHYKAGLIYAYHYLKVLAEPEIVEPSAIEKN